MKRAEYAIAEFLNQGITYNFINLEGLWLIERIDAYGTRFTEAPEYKNDVKQYGRPVLLTAQEQ
jgi:hypothetical protein